MITMLRSNLTGRIIACWGRILNERRVLLSASSSWSLSSLLSCRQRRRRRHRHRHRHVVTVIVIVVAVML